MRGLFDVVRYFHAEVLQFQEGNSQRQTDAYTDELTDRKAKLGYIIVRSKA